MSKAAQLETVFDQINEHHRLAHEGVRGAVEHALECGRLLNDQKKRLRHGEFVPWIENNCSFSRQMASRYMSAALRNADGMAFSSLRGFFPSAPKKKKTKNQEPTSKCKPRESFAQDSKPAPAQVEQDDNDLMLDATEDARLEAIAREQDASTQKWLDADDKLGAAQIEIKRQAAEIASLRISRDGLINENGELVRRVKSLQRRLALLEKEAA